MNVGKQDLAGKLNEAAGVWNGELGGYWLHGISLESVLLAPPKIIYASRTHSQLTQVIQELKRSAYSQ